MHFYMWIQANDVVKKAYSPKHQDAYRQYFTALKLHERRYSSKEIARALHLPYARVLRWIHGQRPLVIKQLARLEELGLLPFRIESREPRNQLILKIGFFTLGDGHISHGNEVILSGYPPDLDEIENECVQHGIKCWRYRDQRYLYIGDNVARLLFSLGFPRGRKTVQKFSLPGWLMNGQPFAKRLFLAIFFGNECQVTINEKHKLRMIILGICKKQELEQDLAHFCEQICSLLKEFGINSHMTIDRKFGFSIGRITISDAISILNFYSRIGLLYARDKIKKLKDLAENTAAMLKKRWFYIKEYEKAVTTGKWDRKVSWTAFYNWTRGKQRPVFYENKREILSLFFALESAEEF